VTDLALFLVLFGVHLAAFALLHVVGLRTHLPNRILTYLAGTYLLGAILAGALGKAVLAPGFSHPAAYAMAHAGAALAGFFAAALYAFLGPATADRSLTAHLLVYLLDSPGYRRSRAAVLEAYSATDFLEKRYEECLGAALLEEDDDAVQLTPKGVLVARLYARMLRSLALDARSEYAASFPPKRE